MPELKVIKFEPEHLSRFSLRGYQETPIKVIPGLKSRAEELNGSLAGSIIADGQIVACAGVIELWAGVGEAWMVASKLVEQYPISFHRIIKDNLNKIQAQLHLHRIQATVRADFDKGHRWIETLGFRCEGLQKRFGPDRSDHYRYARVK